MNKQGILLLLFSSLATMAISQLSVKGKVLNETDQPLAGVSVFISNTSKGTVSSSNGDFQITEIPSGRHELVASSVGYETFVQPFSGDQLPLQLTIRLKLKVREMEGVTVIPFEKDGWAKWGKTFVENFIGTSENAVNCRILNTKAIRFRFFKEENRLTALALEPLIIVNATLGYKLQYQLEEFQVDYKNNSMVYLGFPLFQEAGKKKRWVRAREKAYHGSMMHFIRTLCDNKLSSEGFEVKRLKKIPNLEQERVNAVFPVVRYIEKNPKTGEETLIIGREEDRFPKDSVSYYKRILGQKSYFDVSGDSLLTADSLILVDSYATKWLSFPDYLYVTYKNATEELRFLESIMETNRRPFYQRSSLTEIQKVTIEKNGNYYSPQDMFSIGYWAWSEKIATMLPFDYQPGD